MLCNSKIALFPSLPIPSIYLYIYLTIYQAKKFLEIRWTPPIINSVLQAALVKIEARKIRCMYLSGRRISGITPKNINSINDIILEVPLIELKQKLCTFFRTHDYLKNYQRSRQKFSKLVTIKRLKRCQSLLKQ